MHQTKHISLPTTAGPVTVSTAPTVIHINETPPPQPDDNLTSNPVSTASSSSDDLIILAAPSSSSSLSSQAVATHLDFPIIRPAVFANNFSNIENMRFLPQYQQPQPNATPLETVDASVIATNTSCDNISFNIDLT